MIIKYFGIMEYSNFTLLKQSHCVPLKCIYSYIICVYVLWSLRKGGGVGQSCFLVYQTHGKLPPTSEENIVRKTTIGFSD